MMKRRDPIGEQAIRELELLVTNFRAMFCRGYPPEGFTTDDRVYDDEHIIAVVQDVINQMNLPARDDIVIMVKQWQWALTVNGWIQTADQDRLTSRLLERYHEWREAEDDREAAEQ